MPTRRTMPPRRRTCCERRPPPACTSDFHRSLPPPPPPPRRRSRLNSERCRRQPAVVSWSSRTCAVLKIMLQRMHGLLEIQQSIHPPIGVPGRRVHDVVVRLQESLRLLKILDTVSRGHEGSVFHSAGVSRHLCGALEALGDRDHLLWLRQDTLRLGHEGR